MTAPTSSVACSIVARGSSRCCCCSRSRRRRAVFHQIKRSLVNKNQRRDAHTNTKGKRKKRAQKTRDRYYLHAQVLADDVHLVVLLDASLGFFLRFKIHLPGVVVSEKSSFGFRVDVLAHGCEIVLVELLGEVRDAHGMR